MKKKTRRGRHAEGADAGRSRGGVAAWARRLAPIRPTFSTRRAKQSHTPAKPARTRQSAGPKPAQLGANRARAFFWFDVRPVVLASRSWPQSPPPPLFPPPQRAHLGLVGGLDDDGGAARGRAGQAGLEKGKGGREFLSQRVSGSKRGAVLAAEPPRSAPNARPPRAAWSWCHPSAGAAVAPRRGGGRARGEGAWWPQDWCKERGRLFAGRCAPRFSPAPHRLRTVGRAAVRAKAIAEEWGRGEGEVVEER